MVFKQEVMVNLQIIQICKSYTASAENYQDLISSNSLIYDLVADNSSEAATGGVLYQKVFIEILQNSQENTCARVSFLIKLQASCL